MVPWEKGNHAQTILIHMRHKPNCVFLETVCLLQLPPSRASTYNFLTGSLPTAQHHPAADPCVQTVGPAPGLPWSRCIHKQRVHAGPSAGVPLRTTCKQRKWRAPQRRWQAAPPRTKSAALLRAPSRRPSEDFPPPRWAACCHCFAIFTGAAGPAALV
jgi:hypothetical protein